ncbi:citrate synthase [Anaplasma bovis]
MVKDAVLECDDRKVSLPVLHGTDGSYFVDVTSLYRDHRILTYDPGFMSTAACKSEITFIDGDEGILRYRGVDITELVEIEGGFSSVVYLLLYGIRPVGSEIDRFIRTLSQWCELPNTVMDVIRSFGANSHPMAMLIASFAALSAHYHNNKQQSSTDIALMAVSKVSSIIANIYRHTENLGLVRGDTSAEYTKNFVRMMFGDIEESRLAVICEALGIILIMHADHEQNASTSTVRMVGSTGAELFACLSAGAAALWGPAHGGANEAVINMLESIGDIENIAGFISKVKDGKSGTRLMGFGHRVYKNYDPRAKVMRDICHKVLRVLKCEDKLLNIAVAMEEIALKDEYFIERKLYPNVDFYSGILLRAMGIPIRMFTTIFALGRTAGWVSQWHEMISEGHGVKICRPRQLYSGK